MARYMRIQSSNAAGTDLRSAERLGTLMSVLVSGSRRGLRVGEIAEEAGISNAAVSRLMTGLLSEGVVERDDAGRYIVGMALIDILHSSTDRLDLFFLMRDSLNEIASITEDTVYLSLLHEDQSICIGRIEGAFPIKTLALNIGGRRPIGIGSGSMALVAFRDEEERQRITNRTASSRAAYGFDEILLSNLILQAREQGYTYFREVVVPGMSSIGVPVCGSDGNAFAAVSVSCIAERLLPARAREMATLVRQKVSDFEGRYRSFFTPPTIAVMVQHHMSKLVS